MKSHDLPKDQIRSTLIDDFLHVRQYTEQLASPLSEADAQLQSMPDVSPAKWHLAHTTWFFETFILCPLQANYQRFNETFNYLFNSYYNGIGEQYPRSQRGLISRPSLAEVIAYRHSVNDAMYEWLMTDASSEHHDLVILGLQHEQQHQELFLTDIKHCLFHNPLYPPYNDHSTSHVAPLTADKHWLGFSGGLSPIGYGGAGFSFDNERPQHDVYIHPFQLSSRLVTNEEFSSFIDDGGYSRPELWLADGWAWLQANSQNCPLYWVRKDEEWYEFTLHGLQPLAASCPVVHVNYYEATAYANWSGARLPTEFEWEHAVAKQRVAPPVNSQSLHPQPAPLHQQQLEQCFGVAWQWTTSSYAAYPGFTPFTGVAGEYNGKFMSNQYILRGSSCVTPSGHDRLSYRNFFYAHQAWQFMGIRLAK